MAEKAANEEAGRLLEERATEQISSDDVILVLTRLFKTKPRQDRFGINPPGKCSSEAGSLGLAGYKSAHLKQQCFNFDNTQNVALLLNRWRDQCLGITGPSDDRVRATTIQINRNFSGPVHIDRNNAGPSDVVALGDFRGGRFFLEAPQGAFEREMVCASGPRSPGIYRGDLHDVRNKFMNFAGSTHLHGAEVTTFGERFSLVWFSVGSVWLHKLSAEDLEQLRRVGFRPRSGTEAAKVEAAVNQKTTQDSKHYQPGFLYFARSLRAEMEVSEEPARVTQLLKEKWDVLPDGTARNEREYYARLERIEQAPKRKKTGARKEAPEKAQSTLNFQAATADLEVQDLTDEQDEEGESMNLEVVADLVLSEFPEASSDTDKFIQVLEDLGVPQEEELRARAFSIIEKKRMEAADREMARRLEDGNSPASHVFVVDDSQTSMRKDSQDQPDAASLMSAGIAPTMEVAIKALEDSSGDMNSAAILLLEAASSGSGDGLGSGRAAFGLASAEEPTQALCSHGQGTGNRSRSGCFPKRLRTCAVTLEV
eukprot:TRINITY_DN12140_c0_g1_i1.p1 TRINITY_DN12140_c0_g1~~TRINITY_DN12140_c0_g1_i1.p1  ORF type:complete len:540 (+),score=121.26 TRINITY_DN12140_c0_g1_i1:52-1671(+)